MPLSSLDAVRNMNVDAAKLSALEPVVDGIEANVYAYCRDGESADAAFHARMFGGGFGIPEDPATGSAVAALSGQIAKCDVGADEKRVFLIEQGYEMGRPSQIYLDIEKSNGAISSAGISGSAVLISEGQLHL